MIRSELQSGPKRLDYRRQINREHSPLLANFVLYGSIILASWLATIFVTASMPIVPPFGYLMLVGWRLMRPGTLPSWIGFPLGAVDDLFSGQLFGSAILLWSVTMIAIEWSEARFPWRGFAQDWIASTIAVGSYVILALFASGAALNIPIFIAILPQLLLSVALYPIVAAMVAALDKFRLIRIREVS